MLQIFIRSLVIAFVITLCSFLLMDWFITAGEDELREYCITEGKSDPEC